MFATNCIIHSLGGFYFENLKQSKINSIISQINIINRILLSSSLKVLVVVEKM